MPPTPSRLHCPSGGPDLPGQQPWSALKACMRPTGPAASCCPTPVLAKPELCGVKTRLPSSQLPSPGREQPCAVRPACLW